MGFRYNRKSILTLKFNSTYAVVLLTTTAAGDRTSVYDKVYPVVVPTRVTDVSKYKIKMQLKVNLHYNHLTNKDICYNNDCHSHRQLANFSPFK